MTKRSIMNHVKHQIGCMRCQYQIDDVAGIKKCPICGGHMKRITNEQAYSSKVTGMMDTVRKDTPIELTNRVG